MESRKARPEKTALTQRIRVFRSAGMKKDDQKTRQASEQDRRQAGKSGQVKTHGFSLRGALPVSLPRIFDFKRSNSIPVSAPRRRAPTIFYLD